MKTTFLLFIILISTFFKSQSVIIDIEESGFGKPAGYYRKDMNNLLDSFQGTYVYTNGNKSLKIVLKKMIQQPVSSHYEDIIIGEYQYIENGVEKINTLSNLNIVYSDQYLKHGIAGNGILWNNTRLWKCPQCNPNEKRVVVRIIDKISGVRASFLMRRTVVNGQQVMQAKINNLSATIWEEGTPEPLAFALPTGEFTMIKQ
ncbi:DUF6705 family protein [Chryseobacterium sp. 3008163]|uniref:DUF6705 family protein n=1 Tax=Chryseobacterium sp. 3008163 TaxID=2478663 RepID=UPI000F0C32AB|nr:DUF6705 family protein [Chryseobacterium sp. 3008163]AYN00261.1 hypothetical protein EAG08_07940 [Chryseobacterium sp. 3008163]